MSKSKPLCLITGNQGKADEFAALLGVPITHTKLELTEIQALDVVDVASRKAREAFDVLAAPVFVDDTGFSVLAWQGLPGALIAWFLETVGNPGILSMAEGLSDRRVEVKTAIGYADAAGVKVFTGSVLGSLAPEERGEHGFGYDAIFIPDGYTKTFAEMSTEEKNAISMRKLAVQAMRAGIGLT
jgi:XTP/dITP diphosphohydrolase